MSVASFSGGHIEGAYAMHLRTPQSSSERTRCFTSTILQSSRAQLIVLALFWELDSSISASSRPSMPASTGEWIHMHLCVSALDRWCADPAASVCQNYPNALRARWGSPHGPLQQRARRGNPLLRELDAITSSQKLLHLLV